MADARGSWNETGEKLTELGRKLKIHYEQQHGHDGQESRQELVDAARRAGAAVQDAFEALGAAARDSSVQADVRQVGQSLVEALGATLGQASEEVRRALSERKGDLPRRSDRTPDAGPVTVAPIDVPIDAAEPAAPSTGAPATPSHDVAEPPGEGPGVEPWGTP